jgi:hypothetical protein
MKVDLPPYLYKAVLATTLVLFAIACALGAVFGGSHFVLALVCTTPAGLVALYSLAKKLSALFSGVHTFLALGFIFRLACFAILLYLVLVRFQLSPIGAITGLMLPILAFALVLLYMLRARKGIFEEKVGTNPPGV